MYPRNKYGSHTVGNSRRPGTMLISIRTNEVIVCNARTMVSTDMVSIAATLNKSNKLQGSGSISTIILKKDDNDGQESDKSFMYVIERDKKGYSITSKHLATGEPVTKKVLFDVD